MLKGESLCGAVCDGVEDEDEDRKTADTASQDASGSESD